MSKEFSRRSFLKGTAATAGMIGLTAIGLGLSRDSGRASADVSVVPLKPSAEPTSVIPGIEATVNGSATRAQATQEAALRKEIEQGKLIYLPVDFGNQPVLPTASEGFRPEDFEANIRPATIDPFALDREDRAQYSWRDSAYAYSLQGDGVLIRDESRDVRRENTEFQGWRADDSTNIGNPTGFIDLPSDAEQIVWPGYSVYPLEDLAAVADSNIERNRYAIVGSGVVNSASLDGGARSVMVLRRVAEGQ